MCVVLAIFCFLAAYFVLHLQAHPSLYASVLQDLCRAYYLRFLLSLLQAR